MAFRSNGVDYESYSDYLKKRNEAKAKEENPNKFQTQTLEHDNSVNTSAMSSPDEVGHRYATENYYNQNKSYNNMLNKVRDYSFDNSFDKAMGKNVGSNIESSKAINATVKNSPSSVNELLPEVMSKFTNDMDSTLGNIVSYFQSKTDSMSNDEIKNYAKISDALAQKAGLDTKLESDLLNAWALNKDMAYSLEGLGIQEDAFKTQKTMQTVQTVLAAAGTMIGAIALFL